MDFLNIHETPCLRTLREFPNIRILGRVQIKLTSHMLGYGIEPILSYDDQFRLIPFYPRYGLSSP